MNKFFSYSMPLSLIESSIFPERGYFLSCVIFKVGSADIYLEVNNLLKAPRAKYKHGTFINNDFFLFSIHVYIHYMDNHSFLSATVMYFSFES